MKRLLSIALLGMACATSPSPKTEARTVAVTQKIAVDGVGQGFLSYCKIVRRPACIVADEESTAAGEPMTKADRIACLKPCDTATASKIQAGVDVVRTAQTALFELLRDPDATDAELEAQRKQLRRASEQLTELMRSSGALDLLQKAVQ